MKAHTFNHYPYDEGTKGNIKVVVNKVGPNGAVEAMDNGLVQTGVRYPNAEDAGDEWVRDTASGQVVEFCSDSTGHLDCSIYELIKITAKLKPDPDLSD